MEEKNEKITVREVLLEICQVIVKFFRSCKSKDAILKIPHSLKIAGTKLQLMNIGMVWVNVIFTYMITLSNMAV